MASCMYDQKLNNSSGGLAPPSVHHGSSDGSCSLKIASLETDTVKDPHVDDKVESDITELHNSKKRRKKRKKKGKDSPNDDVAVQGDTYLTKDDYEGTKKSCHEAVVDIHDKADLEITPLSEWSKSERRRMRRKERAKNNQNAHMVVPGDTVSNKDDSIGTNSCLGTVVDAVEKADLKIAPLSELTNSQKKKNMRKKRAKNNQNAHTDVQGDTVSIKDDSIRTTPCLDTVVDADKKADLKIARVSELTKSQRKKKRREEIAKNNQDAHIYVKGDTVSIKDDSIGAPSCLDTVLDADKKADLKMSPVSELIKSQRKRKKSKGMAKSNQNEHVDVQGDTVSIRDDSTGTNSCLDTATDADGKADLKIAPVSELTKSQRKRKKSKGMAKSNQNAHVNVQGDTVSIKDDTIGMNSCLDAYGKVDLKIAPISELAKLQRKRKRSKEMAIDNQNANTGVQEDTISIQDDLTGTNPCIDTVTDADEKANLKIPPVSEFTKSQRKNRKKRKKKENAKDNQKSHIEAQGDTSSMKTDSIGTNSCHDTVVDSNQKDLKISPHSELPKSQRKRKRSKEMAKDNQNANTGVQEDTVSIKDDLTGTNPCIDTVTDANEKANLKIPPVLELTKSQRKNRKKRKKKKENAKDNQKSHIDAQGDTSSMKTDSIGTNSCHDTVVDYNQKDLKISPHSELIKSRKKRNRKKQKLNASVVDDKAQVPIAELDTLISELHSGSLGCPSASLMKKHDHNYGNGLLLVEKENIQTYQINGKLKIYQRRRKSSDSKDNGEPIMVARQASSDSTKVHLSEISENRLERVQAGEFVQNALTEKTTDDITCVENNKIMEMKKDMDLDVHVKGDLPQVSCYSVAGLPVPRADKKLLILDVNGLLADILPYGCHAPKVDAVISRKAVFKRPFCDDFLQFCFEKFNVGVWSSRTKKNLDGVIRFLMGDSRHKLLFCWDQSHCTRTQLMTIENDKKPLFLKELKKLWDKCGRPCLPWNKGEYDESNTLLLDDSPYKSLRNPLHSAIFPHTYHYEDVGDSSLGPGGDLRVYLERLAVAQNVKDFVAQNPFGQQPITESDPSWHVYQEVLNAA